MNILKSPKIPRGWTVVDGKKITKTFDFKGFVDAVSFVNKVAVVAEKENHHPDIDIRWNKVTLTLTTHDVGGLTEKDITMAEKIEG